MHIIGCENDAGKCMLGYVAFAYVGSKMLMRPTRKHQLWMAAKYMKIVRCTEYTDHVS